MYFVGSDGNNGVLINAHVALICSLERHGTNLQKDKEVMCAQSLQSKDVIHNQKFHLV